MKKHLLSLLAILTVSFFAACGGDDKAETTMDASVAEETTPATDSNLRLKMAAAADDMNPEEVKAMIASMKQMVKAPDITAEKKAQLEQQIKVLETQLKAMSDSVK